MSEFTRQTRKIFNNVEVKTRWPGIRVFEFKIMKYSKS